MSLAEDIELLRLYIGDTADPPFLSDPQLESLINRTVDLSAAAAEGWRIKAARVAEWYDVNIDGRGLSRSQVLRHCNNMVRLYADASGGEIVSVKMSTEEDEDESEIA